MQIKLMIPEKADLNNPPKTKFIFSFFERIKILFQGYFEIKGDSALTFQKEVFKMTAEAMELSNKFEEEKTKNGSH